LENPTIRAFHLERAVMESRSLGAEKGDVMMISGAAQTGDNVLAAIRELEA
jgi:hypothetical protein